MSLIDIKDYLCTVRISSVAAMAQYFNTDPELIKTMLRHWERKGCVQKRDKTAMCTQCCKCNANITELYEWVQAT